MLTCWRVFSTESDKIHLLQAAFVCYDLLHATAAKRRGPAPQQITSVTALKMQQSCCKFEESVKSAAWRRISFTDSQYP
ncbi:hypothetical protein TSUD_79470 [Trifolium subterraneum]|uniref:Uncharacterized protein n=1 Tax=Trifolium subterraneum TaxID=3900 RepID=A0A2Z6LMX9_TRISU|nr:hypothetical protein TSUD_79470 [Trifolium subterraneum]